MDLEWHRAQGPMRMRAAKLSRLQGLQNAARRKISSSGTLLTISSAKVLDAKALTPWGESLAYPSTLTRQADCGRGFAATCPDLSVKGLPFAMNEMQPPASPTSLLGTKPVRVMRISEEAALRTRKAG